MDEEKVVAEQVEATEEVKPTVMTQVIEEGTPVITVKKLLEAGAQFGHQTKRWNPKMQPYIYEAKNGIYIIDLQKTVKLVENAYNALKEITEKGGKALFVGTKKQIKDIIVEEAVRSGSFYVTQRWLGGTLTNFKTIQKRIRRLKDIEKMEEDGMINQYSKKEILLIKKEQERLEKFFGGIKEMRKVPNAVFVVDPRIEHNAVAEARKLKIPVFAIVDTNSDPDVCDYLIPANDDAVRSVKLVTAVMADAVCEAKGGLLTVAYSKEEGEDISMVEVMKTTDKINEQRRLAKIAKEKAEQQSFNKNRKPFVRRPYNRDYDSKPAEAKAEAKVEAKVEAPAAKPAEEKKED